MRHLALCKVRLTQSLRDVGLAEPREAREAWFQIVPKNGSDLAKMRRQIVEDLALSGREILSVYRLLAIHRERGRRWHPLRRYHRSSGTIVEQRLLWIAQFTALQAFLIYP